MNNVTGQSIDVASAGVYGETSQNINPEIIVLGTRVYPQNVGNQVLKYIIEQQAYKIKTGQENHSCMYGPCCDNNCTCDCCDSDGCDCPHCDSDDGG